MKNNEGLSVNIILDDGDMKVFNNLKQAIVYRKGDTFLLAKTVQYTDKNGKKFIDVESSFAIPYETEK